MTTEPHMNSKTATFPATPAEPFMTLGPRGLVALPAKVRGGAPQDTRRPPPPSWFCRQGIGLRRFLPGHRYDHYHELADVCRAAREHPVYAINPAAWRAGPRDFLVQVERARRFLSGPRFWFRGSTREGYSSLELARQAQTDHGGTYVGHVSETAMITAAVLFGLPTDPHCGGRRATIYR